MKIFHLKISCQTGMDNPEVFEPTIFTAENPIEAVRATIRHTDYLEDMFKDRGGFKIVDAQLIALNVGPIAERGNNTSTGTTIFQFSSAWERVGNVKMAAENFIKAFE